MSISHRFVTGVPLTPGEAPQPPRPNIVDLVKNKKMFAIYVQALTKMKSDVVEPGKESISYFALAAIHGLPAQSWEGAPPPDKRNNNNPPNWPAIYCTHQRDWFPTWHRPFMGLFEQVLNNTAREIAATYKTVDASDYVKVAQDLRAPFWDFADPTQTVPPEEVISLKKLTIIEPDGSVNSNYDNPLLQYNFSAKFPDPSRFQLPNTARCPASEDSPVTRVKELTDDLNAHRESWRKAAYDMLDLTKTWHQMSSTGTKTGVQESVPRPLANSLESVHNDIHNVVGGGGHMADPSVSAFDPIFWMHHVNVDRLLSFWIALNGPATDTFMGSDDGSKRNLLPFWTNDTNFWVSAQARTTEILNYTYSEFADLGGMPPEEARKVLWENLKARYGPQRPKRAPLNVQSDAVPGFGMVAGMQAAPANLLAMASESPAPAARTEWAARVRVKPHQFGKSFTVLIFCGEPPAEEHYWRTSPQFVGTFSAFVNRNADQCENCRENADNQVEGFVNLSDYIDGREELRNLSDADLVEKLRVMINWRIQRIDGVVVEAAAVEGLEIAVMSSTVRSSGEDGRDVLEEMPRHHVEITTGRDGGRGSA